MASGSSRRVLPAGIFAAPDKETSPEQYIHMVTLVCQAVDKDFYPLCGIFSITVLPTEYVTEIKNNIMTEMDPQLQNFTKHELELWKLSGFQFADNEDQDLTVRNILETVRRSQGIAEKLWAWRPVLHQFRGGPPVVGELHILVQVPVSGLDVAVRVRSDLNDVFRNRGFPRIKSEFITIYVKRYKTWAAEDVLDIKNQIKLLWDVRNGVHPIPARQANSTLDGVREKLDKMRVLSLPTFDTEPDYKAFIQAVNHADGIFCMGPDNMVSKRELDAYNHALRNYMNCVNTIRKESSFLRDAWFTGALVVPPMAQVTDSNQFAQSYKFTSGVGWSFSILVAGGEDNSVRKFSPKPDFMLLPSSKVSLNNEKNGFCPILLGEVVSSAYECDRWRMLLQLAICARVNGLVTKDKRSPLVVQAVYLSKEYWAERYLAYADMEDSNPVPYVYITRDDFNVATRDGAVKFLRSMYNFQDVVGDADKALDSQKGGLCSALARKLEQLPALTSQSKTSKPTESSGPSGSGRLTTIAEHTNTLTRHGYTISQLSTMHRHIAYANTLQGAVVLKCINKARRANEIKLLVYLHQTQRPDNHVIPFTRIFSTQTDIIISMPYQKPLNECSTLSVPIVADFGRQLLEAVRFMHGQGVAHRDLKPENVVVDLHKHRLFIIDYDLAMFVDGRNEMAHGYVGTDGFTAPEVGDDWKERYYSPIAADLWATGRVLEFLLSRSYSPQSPKLEPLRSISGRLLNHDPAQRPGADEALDDILSRTNHPPFYKSSEQPDSSQTGYCTPQLPRAQLTGLVH